MFYNIIVRWVSQALPLCMRQFKACNPRPHRGAGHRDPAPTIKMGVWKEIGRTRFPSYKKISAKLTPAECQQAFTTLIYVFHFALPNGQYKLSVTPIN